MGKGSLAYTVLERVIHAQAEDIPIAIENANIEYLH